MHHNYALNFPNPIFVQKVSNYHTPLEVDQSVIVEKLLYLYAETVGAWVNVDVDLKGSLQCERRGTALGSRTGGKQVTAQVRGQGQQAHTLCTI